jgi:GT2 family glycosyltransferase
MKLSVVIPCYNAERTIAEQMDAFATQLWNEPWEIVVVDNRCTDNSMAIVRRYKRSIPHLRIVDASERQGQPYALNIGAYAAVGQALAFCDADDVVAQGWVSAMGNALAHYDFVACRMDTEKLNSFWITKSRSNPQKNGLIKYNYPSYFPHAGGGTLGVKKELFKSVGGFDEKFPYLHDTDFCWKLQLSGVQLHFIPDALAHIRYRDSLTGTCRQAINYAEYNVLLYKKYRPLGMPKLSKKIILRKWLNFLKKTCAIRSKVDFADWLWNFSWRYGRLKGCVKYHTFAP